MAAQGGAELLQPVLGLRYPLCLGGGVLGIQRIVADQVKEAAVRIVGPGLGHGCDNAAGGPPVLGGEIARHYPEFLERFRADAVGDPRAALGFGESQIEHELRVTVEHRGSWKRVRQALRRAPNAFSHSSK